MATSGGNLNFDFRGPFFCDSKYRKYRSILFREPSTLINYEGESVLPKCIFEGFCQFLCALKRS